MLLYMLKQCLFWENAKSLMTLFEAKTNGCYYTHHLPVTLQYLTFSDFQKMKVNIMQMTLFYCSNALFPLLCKWVHKLQRGAVRPSVSIWTNTLFLALSKFCLRTNHCSAWVQSSPWKEHPDFSRRIHPYHKIPGPRWKLIVCGKLRTQ